jgi:hypothetical protein
VSPAVGVARFATPADALDIAKLSLPEKLVLGSYEFLPWVRSGAVAGLTTPFSTDLPCRGTLEVSVQVVGEGDAIPAGPDGNPLPRTVAKLDVLGPGDVRGIDPRQVIRVFPADGTADAETTCLAHVEFDRPDFPWLFTPAAPAADKLWPWLSLICVEGEPGLVVPGSPLPTITAPAAELQQLVDPWAWAHAQVLGPAEGEQAPSVADQLGPGWAGVNLSRILCPRRLEAGRPYVACLVPTFAAGVAAGLGRPVDTGAKLTPAWDGSDPNPTLPVYYWWSFRTSAAAGDFEYLARRLCPRAAPAALGRRRLDVTQPGRGIDELQPDDPAAIALVEGALQSPAAAEATDTWPPAQHDELRALVNAPADLAAEDPEHPPEDLYVAPPLYGRWYAARDRIPAAADGDWFAELNSDVARRVVAGYGTRVVQALQESLMAAAWDQFGALQRTNEELARAQLAQQVASRLHVRHVKPVTAGRLLQISRPVHRRLLQQPDETLSAAIAASSLPPAALDASFRKLTGSRGPVARLALRHPDRFPGGEEALGRLVSADSISSRSYVRPYRNPDGITELSGHSISFANNEKVSSLSESIRSADSFSHALTSGTMAHTGVSHLSAVEVALAANPDVADTVSSVFAELAPTHRRIAQQRRGGPLELAPFRGTVATVPVDRAGATALLEALSSTHVDAHELAPILKGEQGTLAELPNLVKKHVADEVKLDLPDVTDTTLAGAPIRKSLHDVASSFIGPPDPAEAPAGLTLPALHLGDRLDPGRTLPRRLKARVLRWPAWLPPDWLDELVRPVLAAPSFPIATYEPLRQLGQDYLVPGLSLLPPDTITLLVTNPRFVEAYLLGLNHELGRELLWRGFPTDQRGTYFASFWSAAEADLSNLHALAPGPLGSHVANEDPNDPRVVLTLRGELLRRYPSAHVYVTKETSPPMAPRRFDDRQSHDPVVHGHLDPDIKFAIFPLKESEVRADPDLYFVIAEHPTEPRFGFELDAASGELTWQQVAGGGAFAHAGGALPGTAAGVAQAAFKVPVRVAVKAAEMLDKIAGAA